MYILLPLATSIFCLLIYLSLTVVSNQKFENTHRGQNIEESYFLVYHAKISMQNIKKKEQNKRKDQATLW